MFFGGFGKIKNIFYVGLMLAAVFYCWNVVQTETQTGNIDIQMNVPDLNNHCANGIKDLGETGIDCGGTCPTSCGVDPGFEYPEIFNVASTTNFNQATVSWEVNFKYTGSNNTTTFFYGLGDYSKTATVAMLGTQFSAAIDGLEANTVYDFKISAINNAGLTKEVYGKFTTQEENILTSLTILAHPEKRDPATGGYGDYGVANAHLLFYDAASNMVLLNTSTFLSSTGSTTIYNVEVPKETNLAAILKTTSHLAKRLNGVDTTQESLVLDFTENNTFELLAGDYKKGKLDPTGGQLAQILFDLDRDDIPDTQDINYANVIMGDTNTAILGGVADVDKANGVDVKDLYVVWHNYDQKNIGDIKEIIKNI